MTTGTSAPGTDLRQRAVTRLRKKRELYTHMFVYAVVNLLLIVVWWFTGGFFWPVFPLALWGIGLVLHTWDVYWPQEPTEQRIEREIRRLTH